jgi:fructokinase
MTHPWQHAYGTAASLERGASANRKDVPVSEREVVVAGEALVDLVLAADGSVTAVPGGGPFNAARALARLGAPTAFLGALSTDRFGRLLRATLAGDGVRLDHAVAVVQPTTLALAEVDASGTASYRFYLSETSSSLVDATTTQEVAAHPPAALHVGSLGLVVEPAAEHLAELAVGLPPDVVLFVDPNCRPAAIEDPVRYRARLDRVLDRADVVKVSTEDVAYLEPDVQPGEAAARLRRRTRQVVLLTDGSRPVQVVHATGSFMVPVPAMRVVDTVGAGDAFGGAFLASWLRAENGPDDLRDPDRLRPAVDRAVRAAALTCTRAGAQPPNATELP